MPALDDVSPADTATTEVVIAGAGPIGLMLACELALAGIRTVVLEHRAESREQPQANGLCGQALRMVDHRGLYERLADASDPPLPSAEGTVLAALPQATLVAVLAERAAELGVRIRRGHELVDVDQDHAAATVDVAGPDGPYRLRTDYLVGADGAHGVTRERAGIALPDVAHADGTARIAERLRDRRVFLVGDAAHADGTTDGGSGLDLGLADAFNLGWKLAAAVLGDAGPELLDSYERERRPAQRPTAYARKHADVPTGTDVHYEMGGDPTGEPVGRLAPEMTLRTAGGPVRLAELTTRALPLLVDPTEQGSLAAALRPWRDEVDVVRGRPETGSSPAAALFLRPDCFVAWSSTSSDPTPTERDALRAAAERWLGPRRG